MKVFRKMRRKEYTMSADDILKALKAQNHGFLGTVDKDGCPYVVPLNYIYHDGHIIFHCALEGYKLDNIRNNPKVCFTVCVAQEMIPEKYNTQFISVIAFGEAEIVGDCKQKRELLVRLGNSLAPEVEFSCDEKTVEKTCVVRIKIEHIAGKNKVVY